MNLGTSRLVVEGVSHAYTDEPVLNDVSLAVAAEQRVALMGPSGCGKSTLLLICGGVIAPTAGSVTLGGSPVAPASASERAALRRSEIGIVFQFGELIAELSLTENVALAAELAGRSRRAARSAAIEILGRVGLDAVKDQKPGQVSGGQAQRCAIARALVHQPALVLADEPTGALDQRNAAAVLELMLEVTRERGAALLMATHDAQVAAHCDQVATMVDGTITRTTSPVVG